VHRDDHELERYESERRPGRAPVAKQVELKNRMEKEVEEYRTGFYMPDLQDFDNIVNLQRWDGGVGSLAQVRFARVPQEDPPVRVDETEA
jgi:translation machinery-associated protein 16